MKHPKTYLTLSAAPHETPPRWGSVEGRLTRQLRAAVAIGDRCAATILRARIASVPWKPDDEPTSIWTRRLGRMA